MIHSFNTELAELCGVNAAIIFYNIGYWHHYNETNGTNFYDGEYWTYNSKRAFAQQFPYMSEKQVRTALQVLRDEELIKTGNYNKLPFDRTLWYTISEKGRKYDQFALRHDGLAPTGQDVGPEEPIDRPQWANETDQEGQPIPNEKPNEKPTNIKPNEKQSVGAKAPTRPRKPKESYGEYRNVKLTDMERDKLFDEYGEAKTLDAITLLDEYIEEKGTKYKSHYLTMKRWVFEAVEERKRKSQRPGGGERLPNGSYDWDAL